MKLKFKEMFDSLTKFAKEHNAEIATTTGVICMLGSTALAIRATVISMHELAKKKQEKLDAIEKSEENSDILSPEKQREYDEVLYNPLPFSEQVKVIAPHAILPAAAAVGGTVLVFTGQKINTDKIFALTGALAAKAFQAAEAKDFKEAAKELLGEEKTKEIEDEAARKSVKRRPNKSEKIYNIGTGEEIFRIYYNNTEFTGTMNELEFARLELNKLIYKRSTSSYNHFVKLNEYYEILGLPQDGLGEEFGWDAYDYGPDPGMEITYDYSNRNAIKDDDLRSIWIVRFGCNSSPNYIQDLR